MKKYKAILFDLDGTLADTSPGILNCYRHALDRMGMPVPADSFLRGGIGSPLLEVFCSRFALDEQTAHRAASLYRERYAREGIREARLYDGIVPLLELLRREGYSLGVATLKLEAFAIAMLTEMGVDQYFGVIKGMDESDKLSKAALLADCLRQLDVAPGEALMVGDSPYDAQGASLCGMDFVAVLYGFGFADSEAAAQSNPVLIAEKPRDVSVFLTGVSCG